MEKLTAISFEEYIKTAAAPEETYWFEFDQTGNVLALHPGHVVDEIKNKIQIDETIVNEVYELGTSLRNYKVDIASGSVIKLSFESISGLTKIDDVLHRVIDKKWSNVTKPDISIEYSKDKKLLTFKINPLLKTLEWQGDQDMVFLITEYNDPNLLREMISFNVNELVSYPQRIQIDLPEKFSIYTRRLFDKYTFETV